MGKATQKKPVRTRDRRMTGKKDNQVKGNRAKGGQARGGRAKDGLWGFAEAAEGILTVLLDIVVSVYMLLIIVVLPLYFESGYEHIGSDKSYIFRQISFKIGIFAYALLSLYIAARLVEKYHGGRESFGKLISGNLSPTDLFALVYAAGVILSYCCSTYKEEALLGADKWFMGTLPQLTFVSIYFFVSRFWKKHMWIPALALPVSGGAFLLGYLNRFGIFPIDMKIYSAAFISTIGNINWYCGYVVTVLFAGISLWWLSDSLKKWQNIAFAAYTALGFATLVTQGSDSGLLTLALIFLIMFCLSARPENMMKLGEILCILSGACVLTGLLSRHTSLGEAFEQNIVEYPLVKVVTGRVVTTIMTMVSILFLIFVLICKSRFAGKSGNRYDGVLRRVRWIVGGIAAFGAMAIIVFIAVNTAKEGSLTKGMGALAESLLNFTVDWGSGRGASYRAAVWSFAEQDILHKLVGVGPDCMSAFIYGDGSERVLAVVTEKFGQLRLTNAHNEWLTLLLNQGVIGFASFAGMICSAVYRFIGKRDVSMIAAACGVGVLAYTLNNIFSFQTSVNTPTMFILLGVGECCVRSMKSR